MELQSSGKKNQLIPMILGIVCVVLIITVLFLYRQNIELKRELSEITASQKKQSEIESDYFPSKMSRATDDNISDNEKIKKLESKIADMQSWQDYLEDTLQMQEKEEDKGIDYAKGTTGMLSDYIYDFAKITNLPPDVKTQILDMLPEVECEQGLKQRPKTREKRVPF